MVARKQAVKVVARLRPLDSKESVALECQGKTSVVVHGQSFAFDRVFDATAQQQEVYDTAVKPVVDGVLAGFNGAVIAYGQTGSGKTYSMLGEVESEGIIPRAVAAIFRYIHLADLELRFTIEVSFMEIYNEQLRDLLTTRPKKLSIVNNVKGMVEIKGLTHESLFDESRYFELYKRASKIRSTGATEMNEVSSRSHFIATLRVSTTLPDGSEHTGVLYLVDLAGSERLTRTKAEGTTLEEAKKINGSLHVLGNVINALTSNSSGPRHVPYRDSTLTRVLRDALGGNSRTCLLLTLSPLEANHGESLSTLRFGQRAKMIKNNITANIVRSAAQLEREVAQLKKANTELQGFVTELQSLLRLHGIECPEKTTAAATATAATSDESPASSERRAVPEQVVDLQEKLEATEIALAERSTEVSELRTMLSLQEKATLPAERTTTAGSIGSGNEFVEEEEALNSSSNASSGLGFIESEDVEGLAGILAEMQKLKALWDNGNERLQRKKHLVAQLKIENNRLATELRRSKLHEQEIHAKYDKLIEHTAQALPSVDYAHLVSDTPKPRFTRMLKGGGGAQQHHRTSVGEQALRKLGRALISKSRTLLGTAPVAQETQKLEPSEASSNSHSDFNEQR